LVGKIAALASDVITGGGTYDTEALLERSMQP
jgi:hypothetical protein